MEVRSPREEADGDVEPALTSTSIGASAMTAEQLDSAAISPLLSRIPVQYHHGPPDGHVPPFPSQLELPSADSLSECSVTARGALNESAQRTNGSGSSSTAAVNRTPIPKKDTALRCIFPRKRMAGMSASLNGRAMAALRGKLSAITPDLLLMIMGFLKEKDILLAMSVCQEWRRVGGTRILWVSKGEREPEGRVNWPAFKYFGVLREKKHSMVIKCQSRVTEDMMVVKRILTRVNPSTGEPQEEAVDQGFPVRYLREVSLLRACNHPNVMSLRFVSYHGCSLELFSDYVGQNVEDYISRLSSAHYSVGTPENADTMELCRRFMRQILEAVHYCHSIGIILRDIKPRNVMIDHRDDGLVKLTGFALGRFASLPAEPLTREVVTLSYRAPEILLGGSNPVYSAPIDLWSVGCTMAEIASGKTLFEGDSEIGQLFCIFRLLGTPTEEVWPGLSLLPDFLANPPRWPPRDLRVAAPGLCADGLDLLSQMLQYHPASRISAKDARMHPYFTKTHSPVSTPKSAPAAATPVTTRAASRACRSLQGVTAAQRKSKESTGSKSCPEEQAAERAEEAHAGPGITKRADTESDASANAASGGGRQSDAKADAFGCSHASAAVSGGSVSLACSTDRPSPVAASYGSDVHETLLRNETAHLPDAAYATSHQTRGFATMRRILVEWLVEVVEEAGMKCETLHLAVNYLDRYLAKRVVAREELQLVGITAILVASKHEELAPQSVQNLVIMTDNTYEHADVLKTERDLLSTLDYHLTVLTPLRALELLRLHTLQDEAWDRERLRGPEYWASHLQADVWVLSALLLELAMAEFREVQTRTSTLTAAAALLAVHNFEWAMHSSGDGGDVELERGGAGPAFSLVAKHVCDMMGPLLSLRGGEGLQTIGSVMWRLHGYHASVLPTFATFRKYVAQGRLGVALRPPSPFSSLPRSVTVNGVSYNLAPAPNSVS